MRLIKNIIYFVFKLFKINRNRILFNSFPDFSDNSFALFSELNKKNKGYELIWLVKDKKLIQKLQKEYKYSKFIYKYSLKGFFYFYTSKYIFITHGIFHGFKRKKQQVVVNLWHGMPLKKIGLDDNKNIDEISQQDYLIATSMFFQDIMSKAFGIKKEKVLITGQPRNDLLFKKDNHEKIKDILKVKNEEIILWMPTYRKSIVGDIRIDGEILDVLKIKNLKNIDQKLDKLNKKIIIKIHPMDYINNIIEEYNLFNNIKVINNEFFEKNEVTLYELLGMADKLITDYSSVYIDYLILDKPIGFFIPDLKKYSNDRGFYENNLNESLPGPILEQDNDLINFIINDEDNYSQKRKIINDKYNKYKDNKNSKRILNYFKL